MKASPNVAASVKQRLLNLAKKRGIEFNRLLTLYGFTNTRMKDYFDLWFLAANFSFDGAILGSAIVATFTRRATPLPAVLPTGLTDAFGNDATKQIQWHSFIARSGLTKGELALKEIVRAIAVFLAPPLALASRQEVAAMRWEPDGPWGKPTDAATARHS